MPKLSLNTWMLLGALAGVALGVAFNILGAESGFAETGVYLCGVVGGVFVDLLKMILIPLVFTSIAVGIANLAAHDSMHRVWKSTLAYFLTATALATLLGLFTTNVFKLGAGLNLSLFRESMSHFEAQKLSLSEFFTQFIHGLFMNPLAAMAQGQVLATVVFALFFGIALVVCGEKSRRVSNLLNELLEIIMQIVSWIMMIALVGVLALLAKLTATENLALFASLAKFVTVILGGTLFHGLVVLPLLLLLVTGVGPGFSFAERAKLW